MTTFNNIAFFGTPLIAAEILQDLITNNFPIKLIVTNPDKPKGRGKSLTSSPVKQVAEKTNINCLQPISLKNNADFFQELQSLQPEIIIVVAYGKLIPENILALPKYGCINVHASLLPKYRGAAPIQYAILNGDNKTGISIMQMGKGLDTGDVILSNECAINDNDNSASLTDKLTKLGADSLKQALELIINNQASYTPQDNTKANYAHKITKEMGQIDWALSAINIYNLIRAFNPYPIAFSSFNDKTMRVHEAQIVEDKSLQKPGTIISFDKTGMIIKTKDNGIKITKVQLPGGKAINFADFYNGYKNQIKVGATLSNG